MKSRYLAAAATIAACMTMPVAAHHMADGIVDDDIYDTIDENLEGTPHLDLELDLVSMAVITVTVADADVVETRDAIVDAITEMGDMFTGANDISSDIAVEISPSEELEGWTTITVTQTVGEGDSQVRDRDETP